MQNVGSLDKKIRIAIGLILILIGIFKKKWVLVLGVLFLLSALLRFCVLYIPLKINTMD